jgi:hypothetical protein
MSSFTEPDISRLIGHFGEYGIRSAWLARTIFGIHQRTPGELFYVKHVAYQIHMFKET